MNNYFNRLFPITRSLTGRGVEETYKILKEISDFKIIKVKSGTKIFDWTVPDVWEVEEAYIEYKGKKIIDFKNNNLHLMGYSTPVDKVMSLEELQEHLHSIEKQPGLIPYRTSYYKRNWGFCMKHKQRESLKDGKYHVCIKTTFKKGYMLLGEALLKGRSKKEYLVTTYSCHPSMANDNISGMLAWIYILKKMRESNTHYSYRFLIGPETIGALCHLKRIDTKKVLGALVLTNTAGSGLHGYKETFKGDSEVDKAMEIVLGNTEHTISPFSIRGSDERQYSSPAFGIPTGIIYKTKFYDSPTYHTSGDNKLDIKGNWKTINMCLDTLKILDTNNKFINLCKAEPMLSKRNLYTTTSGKKPTPGNLEEALLWILFYSDGKNDLIDISQKTHIDWNTLLSASKILEKEKLIKKI